MRSRTRNVLLVSVGVVYTWVIGLYAFAFFVAGGATSVLLGVAAVLFLIVGLYVLHSEYRFVRDGNKLLALRTPTESPGSGPDFEDVADSVRRAPDNWQNWLALAEAYREHGDSSAARRAMQRAILLQRGAR